MTDLDDEMALALQMLTVVVTSAPPADASDALVKLVNNAHASMSRAGLAVSVATMAGLVFEELPLPSDRIDAAIREVRRALMRTSDGG